MQLFAMNLNLALFIGWSQIGLALTIASQLARLTKEDIDHIDRDTSNNRINNLRVVTVTQNSANRSMQGAVPAKGVYWEKNRRKFSAQIKVAGVTRFLGRFENIDEAAHAYNKAAVREQGEFALLNPIGKDKE